MTLCTVIYNASSGSDTAASGCNNPTTAVTGTNGDTNLSLTFDLNETVDFTAGSGVLDDGSDVLFVDTIAGRRKLFRITAFNPSTDAATTLTLDVAPATASAGRNWAVGGKRQTLDYDTSNPDLEDAQGGWTYELEGGATNLAYPIGQLNTLPAVGSLADGPLTLIGTGATQPQITWSGNHAAFLVNGAHFRVENVKLINTAGTTAARGIDSSNATADFIEVTNVEMDTVGHCVTADYCQAFIRGCNLKSTGDSCVHQDGNYTFYIGNSWVRATATTGIGLALVIEQNSTAIMVDGCRITDCGDSGATIALDVARSSVVIRNSVFHGNGVTSGDGIEVTASVDVGSRLLIENNIFTSNGLYGISYADSTGSDLVVQNDYNAFYNNTSGGVNSNITKGANSVTLTADPYTDEATDDYTLNATAGGGAACTDAGYGYNG